MKEDTVKPPPWAIMREPGPQAKRSAGYWGPRPRRVGTVRAASEKQALQQYVEQKYPKGHLQFAGCALYFAKARATARLHLDDGDDKTGRRWEMEVNLANGRNEHTIRLYAWRADW